MLVDQMVMSKFNKRTNFFLKNGLKKLMIAKNRVANPNPARIEFNRQNCKIACIYHFCDAILIGWQLQKPSLNL